MTIKEENGHPTVTFSDEEIKSTEEKVQRISEAKMSEEHYKKDPRSMAKRQLTGKLGEIAVCMYLFGKDQTDTTVGKSEDYNVPDLEAMGFELGVKCVNKGVPHVIPMNPKYGEVLCVRDDNRITILGIATKPVMQKFGDLNLIKDEKLRERQVKTGFQEYSKLLSPEKYNFGRFKKQKA